MHNSGTQTATTTTQAPEWLRPAVENYAQDTLSGGFYNSNPYMDDLVNRSSRSIINNVQSNFASAGRNAGGVDPAGVATDRLIDLNAALRGPSYESERNRQAQLIGGLLGPNVTNSIPMQTNVGGNIAGGAMLGDYLFPNSRWGGLIGGGLGGLFG